jgi:hypothetical protein
MHVDQLCCWKTNIWTAGYIAHVITDWTISSRFKFDDERVTKEDVKRALEEQYGGEEEVSYSSSWLQ